MDIKFLQQLRDNPSAYPNDSDFKDTIEPISIQEIETLEQLYNNNNLFPKALRELLYLAGNGCYVLETGWYDSQQELQAAAREWLVKYNKTITRPFFVIDIYGAGYQFLYVYLDEGDNPYVYQAYLAERDDIQNFYSLNKKLSEYINILIDRVKKGINPF